MSTLYSLDFTKERIKCKGLCGDTYKQDELCDDCGKCEEECNCDYPKEWTLVK